MSRLTETLLDLLFPPKCPFCGELLEHSGICERCEAALPWTEEEEQELRLPGGWRCIAPLWYEEAAREAILQFKFNGAEEKADLFGQLMAQCAADRYSGAFDTVTWTPVSRHRRRKRGYDQAKLLAEAACRRWSTRPKELLRKTVDNPAQSGLSGAAARRANVLGVYQSLHPEEIRGRRVLLIDDIVTTGATLAEAARELSQSGAAEVVCMALARTREGRSAEGKNGPAEQIKNT